MNTKLQICALPGSINYTKAQLDGQEEHMQSQEILFCCMGCSFWLYIYLTHAHTISTNHRK